jgi:large exoprotein involved in heme utilization and adhesion
MKGNSTILFLATLAVPAIGILIAGCATTSAGTYVPAMIPGKNESVIVIRRKSTIVGSLASMKVWIDDVEVASSIRNGQEVKYIISDGEYSIQAGSSSVDKGQSVSFSVSGEEITFFAEPQTGVKAARFKLTQTGKRKL